MALNYKVTVALFLLCFLFVQELQILSGSHTMVSAEQIDCNAKCTDRCSRNYKHKMCMKACNTCCERCNCVPPGPLASKDVCPCYANMKTPNGKYKCP